MNEKSCSVLAVIPARGGSKRLPRKNILPCGGKPLIAHTIEAAEKSSTITDTVFSTDDEEIREIAIGCGAYAPFLRPKNLATDTITNKDVMMHALEFMEGEKSTRYDYLVLLQPTAPLRTAIQIDEAVHIITESPYPALASVTGPHKKRHQVVKQPLGETGARNFEHFPHSEFYLFDASIYIVQRDYFVEHDSIFSDPHAVFVNRDVHVDVDTMEDLYLADMIMKSRSANQSGNL